MLQKIANFNFRFTSFVKKQNWITNEGGNKREIQERVEGRQMANGKVIENRTSSFGF